LSSYEVCPSIYFGSKHNFNIILLGYLGLIKIYNAHTITLEPGGGAVADLFVKIAQPVTTGEQESRLDDLLLLPKRSQPSRLEQLGAGSVQISGLAFQSSLERLSQIRGQCIVLSPSSSIPPSRLAALSMFAIRTKSNSNYSHFDRIDIDSLQIVISSVKKIP